MAVKVCCGSRCGSEPNHRAIYVAIENAARTVGKVVVPTMCRSECGAGVTVVLPDGVVRKVSDVSAANSVFVADAAPC